MEFIRFNVPEPTLQEQQEMERLTQMIEKAIAKGRISHDEIAQIQAAIMADTKATYDELHLFRELVLDKIDSGELQYDW